MHKEEITETVNEIINEMNTEMPEKNFFLVQVKLSNTNKITIYTDSFEGITISECRKISKAVEAHYDREVEDYELEVSSAGLDKEFVVIQQYQKNIGKELRIETLEKKIIRGILKNVATQGIKIEETKKIKEKGKKKETQIINHELTFEQIKSAKIIISFK